MKFVRAFRFFFSLVGWSLLVFCLGAPDACRTATLGKSSEKTFDWQETENGDPAARLRSCDVHSPLNAIILNVYITECDRELVKRRIVLTMQGCSPHLTPVILHNLKLAASPRLGL